MIPSGSIMNWLKNSCKQLNLALKKINQTLTQILNCVNSNRYDVNSKTVLNFLEYSIYKTPKFKKSQHNPNKMKLN